MDKGLNFTMQALLTAALSSLPFLGHREQLPSPRVIVVVRDIARLGAHVENTNRTAHPQRPFILIFLADGTPSTAIHLDLSG